MPSGAKKKKAAAAKRKQEEAMGTHHPPNSPTNLPLLQGHDEGDDDDDDSPAVTDMDVSENGGGETKAVEIESEEEGPIREEELEQPAELTSWEAVAEATATEEVVQASETAAMGSDAIIDSPSLTGEAKLPHLVDVVIEKVAAVEAEPIAADKDSAIDRIEEPDSGGAAEVPPAVLSINHRTSWWNCCGLFGSATGSER